MELATLQDLERIKEEILNEVRKITGFKSHPQKKWLKSKEVRELLLCSPGTLQNLRVNGTLEFTKLGGTLYYSYESVLKMLEENKQNSKPQIKKGANNEY